LSLSKIVYLGLGLLVVGLLVGISGAINPVSNFSQQVITLVKTPIGVDPNDYATQNLQMVKGQTVDVDMSIDNQSVMFSFDIMNQTQYYIWYGCAPECHQPLLGGNGTYYERANESIPYIVNETVTPSSPYNASFTAPSNGTYYFVFDNSLGSSWSTYVNHNASGYTVGVFDLIEPRQVGAYSANWPLLGVGSTIMLAGGAVSTIFWESKPSRKIGSLE